MGLFSFFGKKSSPSPQENPRVTELIAQLNSPDAPTRLKACVELRDLKGEGEPASDKLIELLNDPDGDVCNMASQALTGIQTAQG